MNSKLLLCALSSILPFYALAKPIFKNNFREQLSDKTELLRSLKIPDHSNLPQPIPFEDQLPITIVIYNQNNDETFIKKNIDSALHQNYQKYRILYLNDTQDAHTQDLLQSYLTTQENRAKITILSFEQHQGKLQALTTTLRACDDQEIIVLLNGNDWFANECTITTIATAYLEQDIWLTYGSCMPDPKDITIGIRNGAVSDDIKEKRSFRDIFPFMPPLSFYAWLFKQIKEEDLINPATTDFYEHAAECYIIWPLIEMAADHFAFLKSNTYIINNHDPLTKLEEDYYLRMACNAQLDKELPVYQALEKPILTPARENSLFSKLQTYLNWIFG